MDERVVGLRGVEWLRARVAPAMFESCAIVAGEMLKGSVQRKRDHVIASHTWMTTLVGDNKRRSVLPELLRSGCIERVPERWVWWERRPIPYRFTLEYSSQGLGLVQLSNEALDRIRALRKAKFQAALNAAPIYATLWEDLKHISLHDSWPSAMPVFSKSEEARKLAWLHSAYHLESHRFSFSCAPKEGFDLPGRVYTTFTSTPSGLRKYALLDGEPLACVDVKASQPFLHATLISEGAEKTRYLEAVRSGDFYEELGAAAGLKLPRNEIKEKTFAEVFYGRSLPAGASAMRDAFSQLYPNVAQAITARKTPDYRRLALEMQYLEAEIILHNALPRLKALNPRIRVLTVHDALYVPLAHVELAVSCLQSAFQARTGHQPNFKIEAQTPF